MADTPPGGGALLLSNAFALGLIATVAVVTRSPEAAGCITGAWVATCTTYGLLTRGAREGGTQQAVTEIPLGKAPKSARRWPLRFRRVARGELSDADRGAA